MSDGAHRGPAGFLRTGWQHRQLIRQLARRKIEARYRGSLLGVLWAVLHPLLMLCIYSFVFVYVFRAKWDLPQAGESQFALVLFSGLIVYSLFAECVNEAPSLVLSNKTYVNQLRFPSEILPWVSVLSSLFGFVVNLLILLLFHLLLQGLPPATALGLPLVMVPVLLLTLGATWILSSLGVYLRDLSQIVGVGTTALLFLSPIFYPISRVPEAFQGFYYLNPFAWLLQMAKSALFYGSPPDWVALGAFFLGTWAFAWCGFLAFRSTQKGFADVL